MIKVCHIITKLELGGAQQNTLCTVSRLNRQQFFPILITGAEGMLIQEAEEYAHVRKYYLPDLVREIDLRRDADAFREIRRILTQERLQTTQMPLIVQTHSSKAGILGRWAAKAAGAAAIIHTIHGFGFHRDQRSYARWAFIALEWLTARITTHFTAVSSVNIETGLRLRLFPPSKVSLIRSGIDLDVFQQFARLPRSEFATWREKKFRALGLSPEKPLIGMAACFKPQKAPLEFVQVMKRVAEAVPNAQAVMIGDGELRPQIEDMIARERLTQTITLLGWRTDMPELFSLFSLLALTSHWEGLPRVCPQAMAAGIPIVATNVDGIPEAVKDGVNGFLRPPGDIDGLAEKIIFLLQHPKVSRQMGSHGLQLVEEFDSRRMVRQQEELYLYLARRAPQKSS